MTLAVDWGTVWNAINSNLVGLVISALLGVGLASYIQHRQYSTSKKTQTRKTAILLGGEIYSIQRLCDKFSKDDTVTVQDVKSSLEKGITLVVTIGDNDFPRTVYDKPSTDIGLFSDRLAATIAELYRFLDFSKDAKMKANGFSAELGEIIVRLESSSANTSQITSDNHKRILVAQGFIRYYEIYVFYLGQIAKLSTQALTQLEAIEGILQPIGQMEPNATQSETA